MDIKCPECGYTRIVPDDKIPPKARLATCPKCSHKFKFRDLESDFVDTAETESMSEQPPREMPDNVVEFPAGESMESQPPVDDPAIEDPAPETVASQDRQPEPASTPPHAPESPQPRRDDDKDVWDNLESLTRDFDEGFGQERQARQAVEDPEGDTVPFEDLEKWGFFNGMAQTIKRSMLAPMEFFGHMAMKGKAKPLIFYVLVATASIVVQLVWDRLGLSPDAVSQEVSGLADIPLTGTMLLAVLILAPLFEVVGIYLHSGLFHLALKTVGGANKGFEATFRASCYSCSPLLLSAIPYVGSLAGSFWSLAIFIIGMKNIHQTTYIRIVMAFGLLIVAMVAILAALVMAMKQFLPPA